MCAIIKIVGREINLCEWEGSFIMNIQPFGERVVIKILAEEEKVGALIVTVSKDKSNKGEVVAVGEGVTAPITIGDKVLFNLSSGVSYSTSSEEYKILNIKDILGKIIKE